MDTIEKIKQRLLKRREDLLDRISRFEHELRIPKDHSLKILERAKLETGTLMKIKMDFRDAEELKKIDQALDRIQAGTYGTCLTCGEPISLKRLELLPETARCRKCARQAANDS